jgi:hypothetical protein
VGGGTQCRDSFPVGSGDDGQSLIEAGAGRQRGTDDVGPGIEVTFGEVGQGRSLVS